MTTIAEPRFDMLVEIQLPTPLYRATSEEAQDELGRVYQSGLAWPSIRRELSKLSYGIMGAGSVTLELAAGRADGEPASLDAPSPANLVAAAFRAVEARGVTVVLRRLSRATGACSIRFTGQIQRVEFTSSGGVRLEVADTLPDTFGTSYPRLRITPERWPTATSEALSLGATVPLHFGTHREHTPARHVEATDRVYAHGSSLPRLFTTHRYVVAGSLARALQGDPSVLPTVLALYRGMPIGAALIPPGEYAVAINRKLVAPVITGAVVNGGLLVAGAGPTPTRAYQVTALNGCGEGLGSNTVILTITAANVTAGNRSVRLDWTPIEGAVGYAVSVTDNGLGQLLSIVAGGDAASFLDPGPLYQGIAPYVAPLVDTTGQGTVEIVFRQPQLGIDNALAPILADVATMRRAWDGAACRSVWHFDGDTRDARPARQNALVRLTTTSRWDFERDGRDRLGPNHLTMTGVRPDDYVIGPWGKPTWLANGAAVSPGYGYLADAAQVGLDPGTGSFRIDVEVRTDPDTLKVTMVLVEKWGTDAWYSLRIMHGKLYATVKGQGNSNQLEVFGHLRLDGARHRLSLSINRATEIMALFVDGILEDSTTITGLGSLANNGAFAIGSSAVSPGIAHNFRGEFGWVQVDTDPAAYLPAGSVFDGTDTEQRILMLPSTVARDLDVGTSTGWCWEAQVTMPALPTDGATYLVAGKLKLSDLTGLILGISRGPDGTWQVVGLVGWDAGATVKFATGGSLAIGVKHNLAVDLQAATPTVAGALRLYADGALVATTPLPAGATPDLSTTGPVLVGGLDPSDLTTRCPATIHEVRVSARSRSASEHAEVHYLASRNLVRQVRSLLSSAAGGPGLTLDTVSWDRAERDLAMIESGKLVTDYAMVEPQPLGEHLAELLKVRSVRLALTDDGVLGCSIDQVREVIASFGRRDGYWENLKSRPAWKTASLKEVFRKCRIRFRRKRSGAGDVDRFTMRTSERDVLTIGGTEAQLLDYAGLRDVVAADITAGYTAHRLALLDQTVSFPTRDDEALAVVPGDLVTLYDPISGRSATVLEVQQSTESGNIKTGSEWQFDCGLWGAEIYDYVPGTLPIEPDLETRPDYSVTNPEMVADFAVTFDFRIRNEDIAWVPTATWSKPTFENVSQLLLEWMPTLGGVWQPMYVGLGETRVVIEGQFDDNTSYDFRLSAINRFGRQGPPSTISKSTGFPDDPSTPTGLQALAASAARSRVWKCNVNPEKNLRGYDWQVYASNGIGGDGLPTGQLKDSGRVRHERFPYTETGLLNATKRYCRIRAVNASGRVSAWTAFVEAVGSTVATDDVDPDAITKTYVTTATAEVNKGASVIFTAVGNLGGVVIPEGGANVDIAIDLSLRLINWGEGSDTAGIVAAQLVRGGVAVPPSKQVVKQFMAAVAGDPLDLTQAYHLRWSDTPPVGTYTYVLQLSFLRTIGISGQNVGATPWFNIVVRKR